MATQQDRISELEAEVAKWKAEAQRLSLKATRQPVTDGTVDAASPDGVPVAEDVTERIYVNSPDDLYLLSAPSYLRQLLDHLPVQVFIKHQERTARGRKYTYLNREARTILNWAEIDIVDRFDSDAFEGGISNPEWKKMIEVETETINNKKKTIRELRWTPSGEDWRLNTAIQVPVILREPGSESDVVIGFCAIAQDITFRQFKNISLFYTRALLHEYGNLCNSIIASIDAAQRNPTLTAHHLTRASNRAMVAKEIAASIFEAIKSVQDDRSEPVGAVVDSVEKLAAKMPVDLTFEVSEEVKAIKVRGNVTKAILLQLLQNAQKHTSDEFLSSDRAPIKLTACLRESTVVWTISNRVRRLKGHLTFDNPESSSKIGGTIMGEIIRRAYGTDDPSAFIEFPRELDSGGWVNVNFRVPVYQS